MREWETRQWNDTEHARGSRAGATPAKPATRKQLEAGQTLLCFDTWVVIWRADRVQAACKAIASAPASVQLLVPLVRALLEGAATCTSWCRAARVCTRGLYVATHGTWQRNSHLVPLRRECATS